MSEEQMQEKEQPITVRVFRSKPTEEYQAPTVAPSSELGMVAARPSLCLCKCGTEVGSGSGG